MILGVWECESYARWPLILPRAADNPGKDARCTQMCALNGYGCVDTEYAWYQKHQQQQQHLTPYSGLLIAASDDDDNKTKFVFPATPVDYCPSCVALYAAEADTSTVPEITNSR